MKGEYKNFILCLVGPTGTGKSHLAVSLAKKCGCEIINFDSRQVYRDLPIVTAQPDETLRAKCPHWLYGFLSLEEKTDAGYFSQLAERKIEDIRNRGKYPLLVGGTGLYLKAILSGLDPMPDIPQSIREKIWNEYQERGIEVLYGRLKSCDYQAAKNIHPKDKQRITRALEVYEASGKPISWWQTKGQKQEKYSTLKIGLNLVRSKLRERLAVRIEKMLVEGAVDEIGRAWEKCPKINAPGWTGIGCFDLLEYVWGRCTLEEAQKRWLKKTTSYAKRQMTWFRQEQGVNWFESGQDQAIIHFVNRWLANRK